MTRTWAAAIVTLGIGGLIQAPLDAQGRGRGRGQEQPPARIRFQAMDANSDRVITRGEWRGSPRSFEVHDWNGDGVLSGVEVQIGGRRPARSPGDLDSPWTEPSVDDWTTDHFRDLDRNRDGRLSATEWIYDRGTFRRIDHDGDGTVTQAEFLGNPDLDDDAEDLFEYLDANDDGRVDRNEWHGTRARFDALDANRDGVVTRREAVGTDAPRDLFDAIDVNTSEALERSEWRWSAASFERRDHNRDGRLTREEFTGMLPERGDAYRAGYDRGLIDGRQAGREDRERNQGWDLEGQRELEEADAGYQNSMGRRVDYQAGYREAFRRGYREGWGR